MAAIGARTMDEIKDGCATWAHEIKTHEMEKRRVLDEGFLRPPAMKLSAGAMKSQERVFDPVLQRYRDHGTEYKQRLLEETERVNHLNRAMDIQVVREQPHHILTHESKFDVLAPGQDPTRQPGRLRKSVGKTEVPTTAMDFNIISNLPHDVHHWNRPDERPRHIERTGKQRKIHANRVKDFNIVNNRYPFNHEERIAREKELNLAEATQQVMTKRRFDPVTQQFNDPKDEETAKHCDDAREVEVHLRAQDQIPPSYKGRHTNYYDAISGEVHNPPMVRYLQQMEAERKDRYKNRYIVEHNFHAQDIKGDHMREARKLNKVAPERFMEHDRGYDCITNKLYGSGPKEQAHYSAGYPQRRKTPWEEIEHSHSINGTGPIRLTASTPALPSSAAAAPTRSDQPAVSSAPAAVRSNSGAATPARSQGSQRSRTSQRSQKTLSEAGGRAVSNSGSVTSAAQYREPPGATRPIVRSSSTPNLAPSPLQPVPELSPAPLRPVQEMAPAPRRPAPESSASDLKTRKLPTPLAATPLGANLTIKFPPPAAISGGYAMSAPPPPPAIPGSPVGSVYSRPSAKPC